MSSPREMSASPEPSLAEEEDVSQAVQRRPSPGQKRSKDDIQDDDESDGSDLDSESASRRVKRRAVDAFIDREAVVDDDEEDFDDEDEEQEIAAGFIENEEEIGQLSHDAALHDDRRHRELDQQNHRLAEADAERMAAQFKERYGRSNGVYRGDQTFAPQRLLLPSVEDPSIWGIRCKAGKEDEIVFNLLRKQVDREHSVAPLRITSVFTREHLPGYIYVEAVKQKDVLDAMSEVSNVYMNKLVLVPVPEMPELLRVRNKGTVLVPGAFIRIRKNNKRYAGDLGRINDISLDGTEAIVALVPRLDYSNQEDLTRKNLIRTSERPAARLFNGSEVERVTGLRLRDRSGENAYEFNGDEYVDGLLIKTFRLAHLVTEPEEVKPTLEEMQTFSSADASDLASLGQGIKTKRVNFTIGDTAEVFSGEQTGVYGMVISISKNVAELRATDDSGLGTISVPISGLRKRFSLGHQVRVQAGKHAGETGSVVAISGDTVTMMTNLGKEEITVFSRDLGEITEVSEAPSAARFEVRDVVELNATDFGCVVRVENNLLQVLMPAGDLRTIKADSVARKIPPPKFGRTTDRNGNTIQISAPQSTVQEVGLKGRKGKVFNIHLHTVFCHNIEIAENNGVFVCRDRDVEVSGMGSAKIDFSKQNPMLKMNAAMGAPSLPKTMGRDKAIGQTIWIRKGPQKGLMGIVTDTTETIARIEPHNGLKKISVQKDLLGFRATPDSKLMSYAEFMDTKSWRANDHAASTDTDRPIWAQSGNRTPRSFADNARGSRTPAWAGGDARTPAWTSGAATPGWTSSGSKTPTWGGNKTPSWSGNKTPSWTGNATPAWYAPQ